MVSMFAVKFNFLINYTVLFYRGESFRKLLLRIGEIRSLLPDQARIIPAMERLRKTASTIIVIKDEVVMSKLPCKNNIMHAIVESAAIQQVLPIAKRLCEDRASYPRTLIYCRSYTDCSSIYLFFKTFLGNNTTEPAVTPDIPGLRLVDMYMSCTGVEIKDKIKQLFMMDSPLRVIIATTAIGLGIDCPDVWHVINFGVPSNIESYVQEMGRAGRDSLPSLATLVKNQPVENSCCSHTLITIVVPIRDLYAYVVMCVLKVSPGQAFIHWLYRTRQ